MYQSNYSFSMPKPYHSIDMPKTFPEDIECIIKGKTPEAGSLYISNVEAASNPNTLKSTPLSIQNSKLLQFSAALRGMSSNTRGLWSRIISTFLQLTTINAIFPFISIRQ